MNITALRPRFKQYLEPVAGAFVRCGITPNQCSFLALVAGIAAAALFVERQFLIGSIMLLLSALFDLIDGSIARKTNSHTNFGAVFDWIVDKYVDALVILGVGLSGITIVSGFLPVPRIADFAIIGLAMTGSLMNTFIKPLFTRRSGTGKRWRARSTTRLKASGSLAVPKPSLC